jgi:hypothetical protein
MIKITAVNKYEGARHIHPKQNCRPGASRESSGVSSSIINLIMIAVNIAKNAGGNNAFGPLWKTLADAA